MASLTLSIPEDLRKTMRSFPEINWSEVARQAITQKAKLLGKMDELSEIDSLSDEEVKKLSHEVKKRVWKKHGR